MQKKFLPNNISKWITEAVMNLIGFEIPSETKNHSNN